MKRDIDESIQRLCPEVAEGIRRDFLTRMDEDYFSAHPPVEIARHLRLAAGLTPERPVAVQITPLPGGRFTIVIVAFDYFSIFSVICGLLASFGLDIQSGDVHTFSESAPPPRPRGGRSRRPAAAGTRRKIVDVFRVLRVGEAAFDAPGQKAFEEALRELVGLLDRDRPQEAREKVNRRLIEAFSKTKNPLKGLLYPVEVRFDNQSSDLWTVMSIRSRDTPAFLYAFSNALALRGIYIHKVIIESIGAEVQDRVYVSDLRGKKIEGKRDQEALTMAVAMIKQFTHFLASAPDPARATRYFDQLLDKLLAEGAAGRPISFLKRKKSLELLARLLGASDFLWEDFLRIQFDNLLPVLRDLRSPRSPAGRAGFQRELARQLRGRRSAADQKRVVNEFKDREMFRIDMAHLAESPRDLTVFSRSLTDLAEAVLESALKLCAAQLKKEHGSPRMKNGRPSAFSILGLGKFGGRELGYASDIELMFVYEGSGRTRGKNPVENSLYFEKLSREILHFIEARQEGIFHIDLRLRPDGEKGPLACALERLSSYYGPAGGAAPFERQALTKLRRVAGDIALGKKAEAIRDAYVYGPEPWDLKTALHLRGRQERELAAPGTVNVKYSPGGVIEIEYAVQYLQILHGRDRPELRTPSTLEALAALGKAGLMTMDEGDRLREAYLFLRALIDALRMVRGNARDLVLPEAESEAFQFLARRLGYSEKTWKEAARRLDRDIRSTMAAVHAFFTRRFPPPRDGGE